MVWIPLLLLLALPRLCPAVILAWDFTPPVESFIVSRGVDDGPWSDVATVPVPAQGTTTAWADPFPPSAQPHVLRHKVRSRAQGKESAVSNEVVTTQGGQPLLPQSAIVAAVADSQEMGPYKEPASLAIDGNPATIWHTPWSGPRDPPHPHWLTLDLGTLKTVDGLRYTPRATGGKNGTITDYEIRVSVDGTTWGAPVQQGSWAWTTQTEEIVRFAPTVGRFVQLRALKDATGGPWTSAAEVAVYAGAEGSVPPGDAKVTCVETQPAPKTLVITCTMP